MLGQSLYLGEVVELSAIDVEKDAAALSKWSIQPQFCRRFSFGFFRPITESEMKKKLTETLKKADETKESYFFAVRKRSEASLLGLARFVRILFAHQIGTIQLDFAELEDLHNYGKETLKLMMRYGFMEMNLYRIDVNLPAYETEMISLFEKNGFAREIQRREAVYHGGRYWDELVYSQLKPEYKKSIEESTK